MPPAAVPAVHLPVVLLHGLTGTPAVLGPAPQRFVDAGHPVRTPTLPGHGTSIEELARTDWQAWEAAAERALEEALADAPRALLFGLSMGGTLAVSLATRRPEIAGLVLVNPVGRPEPELKAALEQRRREGETLIEPFGEDVAAAGVALPAYGAAPIDSMLELLDAAERLQSRLADVRCPTLLLTSAEDHLIAPAHSDTLAAGLGGPVTRLTLRRSYHLAMIDHDKDLIADRAVAFAAEIAPAR